MEEAASKHGDKVEVKIYYAGKDFDYVKKYGVIFRGTMIINEKIKIEKLSKNSIEEAIDNAVKELEK